MASTFGDTEADREEKEEAQRLHEASKSPALDPVTVEEIEALVNMAEDDRFSSNVIGVAFRMHLRSIRALIGLPPVSAYNQTGDE